MVQMHQLYSRPLSFVISISSSLHTAMKIKKIIYITVQDIRVERLIVSETNVRFNAATALAIFSQFAIAYCKKNGRILTTFELEEILNFYKVAIFIKIWFNHAFCKRDGYD